MKPVLIVHGWDKNNGGVRAWEEVYGPLRSELQAQGLEVQSVVGLPGYRNGNTAFDAAVNAVIVSDFLRTQGRPFVVVGHSYGGMVVEYMARINRPANMAAYATLDSAVHEWPGAKWPYTKLWSWLINPPDQWAGSAVRKEILAASVPMAYGTPFNVWANSLYRSDWPHVLNLQARGDHTSMLTHDVTVGTIVGLTA